ncbi:MULTISPECIES: hypothetical protein [unclassified Nostoc]|uniref:hypothetical protein n=1 Tax=unclassified Nostoc TaxID=2593658 RepID=UPI001684A347|nr:MULTISPECIES: hypothetical protein [unclassified Nostoc]MBD2468536.1 hypothetical protein [Nostoc sp. FACHB-145]
MSEEDKKKLDEAADNVIKVGSAITGLGVGAVATGLTAIASPAIAVGALGAGAGTVIISLGWKYYRHLAKNGNK